MDWKKTIEAYDVVMSSETFRQDKEFRQRILSSLCDDVELQTVHRYLEHYERRGELPRGLLRASTGSRRRLWPARKQRRHRSFSL
jgi:hypothetical protein